MTFRTTVAAVLTLLASSARADTAQPVTTDTPEYCESLHARVLDTTQVRPPNQGIAALTQEGATMCRDGQVRAGITRLRRALIWERSNGVEPVR